MPHLLDVEVDVIKPITPRLIEGYLQAAYEGDVPHTGHAVIAYLCLEGYAKPHKKSSQ